MKKLFLFFAASAMIASAVAQKPAVNPIPVKVKQVVRNAVAIEPASSMNLPKPMVGASKAVTPVKIGTALNYLSVAAPTENHVSYNAALDVISFGHRGGPTNATGNDILNPFSTDGGTTWDTTNLVYSKAGYSARYPAAALYNPTGNTDVANLYSIVAGRAHTPAGTFMGSVIGWKKNSGVAKNYVIEHNNADRFDFDFFQIRQDGRFYSASSAHTDNGSAYTKFDFGVLSGKLNSATDSIEELTRTTIVPPFAKFGADTVGQGWGDAAVAFNKAGTVGYFVTLGVRGDVANVDSNLSNRPIVFKTTDQGATWVLQPDFDFKNVAAFGILPSVWQDTNVILPYFYGIDDVIVDGDDNLHILSYVAGRSTNAADIDSAGFTWNYTSIEGIMFDTYTTASGWNATAIDYVYGKTLDAPVGNDIDIVNRLQAGISEDGKNIFYAWEDTDPANGTDNVLPDAYVNGRNIDSLYVYFSTKANLTTGTSFENSATMLCMAPEVKEVAGVFYPHIVLTQLGSDQSNDPVSFYYLKGSQLQLNVSVKNIDNNISNVSNIYPNPTNGLSSIDLSLVKSSDVTIQVVNMMGQVVSSQDCGHKTAGMHKLSINASDLTSGIYFVTVRAGNSTSTSKMIVR